MFYESLTQNLSFDVEFFFSSDFQLKCLKKKIDKEMKNGMTIFLNYAVKINFLLELFFGLSRMIFPNFKTIFEGNISLVSFTCLCIIKTKNFL